MSNENLQTQQNDQFDNQKHTVIVGITEDSKNIELIKPELTFSKTLLKKIMDGKNQIRRESSILSCIDWSLFITSSLCMTLVTVGLNQNISDHFTISQMFGIISLVTKTLEKKFALNKVVKDKQIDIQKLNTLIRDVSSIEIEIYTTHVDRDETIAKLTNIWKKFDDLEIFNIDLPNISNTTTSLG
jgi:hypothetical protein